MDLLYLVSLQNMFAMGAELEEGIFLSVAIVFEAEGVIGEWLFLHN